MNESPQLLLTECIQTLDAATGLMLRGVDSSGRLEYVLPSSTRMFYMKGGEIKSIARFVERDHSEIKKAFEVQ